MDLLLLILSAVVILGLLLIAAALALSSSTAHRGIKLITHNGVCWLEMQVPLKHAFQLSRVAPLDNRLLTANIGPVNVFSARRDVLARLEASSTLPKLVQQLFAEDSPVKNVAAFPDRIVVGLGRTPWRTKQDRARIFAVCDQIADGLPQLARELKSLPEEPANRR